ncbi:MAG: ABC transporter ATP-binding protein [Elusimicrobia bacterium]|nr:ABC transporter ATP-binding protein [Candidatus Obscuribacterium magneticum]
MTHPDIVDIHNLTVEYIHGREAVPAVRDVSLELAAGETLALVGESGCGKSTLALALMGLLPRDESRVTAGEIHLQGENLLQKPEEERRHIRGRKMAMIFQDPFSALNPVLTVGYQLQECIILNEGKPNSERSAQLLRQVQIKDPERILTSYPHQVSGGQRQRVLIAMALAGHPELLIADEPTTALDVTVQDEIMKLLKGLRDNIGMSMLFITHNMALVKGMAHRLAVMYAGQIVEYGATTDILTNPKHPYTQGLLRSLPKIKPSTGPIPALSGQPPDPMAIPSGCPFHPRCEKILPQCPRDDPADRMTEGQRVRCHLY